MNGKNHPLALIILDGWGHRETTKHNAIAQAKTPFFDELISKYPHTLLNASQEHVGLPKGTIGNSEIGHMTMGAGKIIDTELVRINKALKNNELLTNRAVLRLIAHVKKHNSTLHILGMVSPIGVHSHQEHLHTLLKTVKKLGVQKVAIHAFTDGRDAPPKENHKYLKKLEKVIEDLGIGYIATATGRYFAMDRDKNWHRTQKAVDAIFEGRGKIYKNRKPSEVLQELYNEGAMDEYLEPIIFLDETGKDFSIQKNDGIFFFNFRTDRPRQLSYKIMERAKKQNLFFVTMTRYHPDIKALAVFPPIKIQTTLSAEISKAGLKQAHIAETEKYGHVTFFFNGGKQTLYKGEKHYLIKSRKDVPTHDLAPEMRAREIADKAIERIQAGDDFLLINFANADMVGHTANLPAIIKAIETVDRELKRVVNEVVKHHGSMIITADHGNAEVNIDPITGEKHTAHTTNMVPCILVSPASIRMSDKTSREVGLKRGSGGVINLKPNSTLADIAPTILQLLNLKKPVSMTGKSLIQKLKK